MDESMKLPEGKTCGDCVNWIKCYGLFMCPVGNTSCDFHPIKFVDCKDAMLSASGEGADQ